MLLKRFSTYLILTFCSLLTFAQEVTDNMGLDERIDRAFGNATGWFVEIIFYQIPFTEEIQVFWVLFPLILGALYFTFVFRVPGLRLFGIAINTVRGKYEHVEEADADLNIVDGDEPDTIRIEGADGEVNHFQALTAALSATVGLGNIAGVAVAIAIGGPGAVFWMILAGLLGMSSKFVECTLGVKFREVDENGKVYGGPMYYLKKGLAGKNMAGLGKVLAIIFAVMCVGGSFGGGNMFQVNQAYSIFDSVNRTEISDASMMDKAAGERVVYEYIATIETEEGTESVPRELVGTLNVLSDTEVEIVSSTGTNVISATSFRENGYRAPFAGYGWLFGLVISIMVAVVIIGGIQRIAKVTEKIVPFMAVVYVGAALVIIFMKAQFIPEALTAIFHGAFTGEGVVGGAIGVLIQGFRRAAFSNEAGVGSAAIAHSAVKTKHAASEGVVALLEPFIDTVVICTMTALVIIMFNIEGAFAYGDTAGNAVFQDGRVLSGVDLTTFIFEDAIPNFGIVLTIAVILFAFSTMISWSYYGLQSWTFLFGKSRRNELIYKLLFCLFVVIGAAANLGSVLDFSDAMIFSMMVPNMIGLLILYPHVRDALKDYLRDIKKT